MPDQLRKVAVSGQIWVQGRNYYLTSPEPVGSDWERGERFTVVPNRPKTDKDTDDIYFPYPRDLIIKDEGYTIEYAPQMLWVEPYEENGNG